LIFKSEIVFVKLVIPLAAGMALAYQFQNLSTLHLVKIGFSTILLCSLLLNLFYKSLRLWRFKVLLATIHFMLFLLLGALLCLQNTDFLKPDYFAHKTYPRLKAWVADEPQIKQDIMRFELNITQGYTNSGTERCSGKLLIALKVDSLSPIKLSYGDELIFNADYKKVEPPYNPGEFDFKKWLASKNVYEQAFIRQDQLFKTGNSLGNPFIKWALVLRQKQVAIYRSLLQNDEAFAVASTLILGYRADLDKETLAAYSKTGTIHALSVSGMHVGIIYIMLSAMLVFLNKTSVTRIIKLISIIALIWAYALLTGFSPSVLRSAIMLSIFIIAKHLNKSNNSYNVLAFTAFALLLFNPFYIWDVGFQLSFLSVFGLVFFQPRIYQQCYFKNKLIDKMWSVVALSLAAQLATLPLSIYYFNQFPLLFIVSNLFILIPVTLMMYIGLAILVLHLHFLAPIFEWIIVFNNEGLKLMANLPFANLSQIYISVWQMCLLYLLVLLISYSLIKKHKTSFWIALALVILFEVSSLYQQLKVNSQRHIHFFSLRKNYAAAFIEGNKAVLISDLKAEEKNYQFFVKPMLEKKGIVHITRINSKADFSSGDFSKKQNQIIFKNQSFLLLDSQYHRKKISKPATFDYVWLQQSPKYALDSLIKELNFKHLILDASNKDYYIAQAKKNAQRLGLRLNILKKQPGLSIDLNPTP